MPVDFGEWVRESHERVADSGSWGAVKSLYHVYTATWLSLTRRFPLGTNIYERDWDALVILDACRADALREVASEYGFLGEIESIRSVGSASFEWMPKTFTNAYRDEVRQTAYVCGNPYTERVFDRDDHPPAKRSIPFGPTDYDTLESDDFYYLDEISKYGFDERYGVVPPRTVTDRAIAAGRERDCNRLIVHYMQPHAPYFTADGESARYLWGEFKSGDISKEEMWEAYLVNLRYVLEDVELLLRNLDADRVAITANHGEAFGEFGTYGYTTGHPHPALRRVPWTETTAADTGEYEPTTERPAEDAITTDLDDHLRDLGYL